MTSATPPEAFAAHCLTDGVESPSSSPASPDGELKQVTVLSCRIADSTSLAERLGPEAMLTLLKRFFDLALKEVHHYRGTVNAFLGDGFTALFGVPVAHEDHARRAVLAALRIHQGVQELSTSLLQPRGTVQSQRSADVQERGAPCSVRLRIGASSGLVAVGEIGNGLDQHLAVAGDTIAIAVQLQEDAEPGMILVSEATARMITGYLRLEAVGPVQVQGKHQPVMAYRVLGLGPHRSPLQRLGARPLSRFVGRDREMAALRDLVAQVAGHPGVGLKQHVLSPFVGRDRDLAVLQQPLAQVEAGQGQVVEVVGEPGMGKSRLIYEFRHSLAGQRVTYLEGCCLPFASAIPYFPILDIVRENCAILESDAPDVIAVKVRVALQEVGLTPDEWAPYILHLLGMKEGTEPLLTLSPEAIKERAFDALRQWVLRGSKQRPIILVVEDLHWIDSTSEEFLASLVESLAGTPILLLCTWRPGYQPPWSDHTYVTRLVLRPLGPQDSLHIVQSVLRTDRIPEQLARAILTRAEGNPFFLEELTRAVVECDELHEDQVIPETIHGVIMARIDRLPEALRRALQTASVLGREFSLRLLGAIWDGPDRLVPYLQELKRLEFVYERVSASEPTYVFKHALTQEVTYESLLPARRRALHAAAGRALERLYANRLDEVYDQLAYHYSRAEDAAKATEYLIRFAEKAARIYAHADAARALEEALHHVERLPTEEQDRRILEIVLRLAHSLYFLGRVPATRELLLKHQERLQRLQDPELAGPYYFWLAHTYSYLNDYEKAILNAQRALVEGEVYGDRSTMGKAYYVLARLGFWSCRYHEGIEHGRRAISLLEVTDEPLWLGQSHWAVGLNFYFLGEFDAALEAENQTRAIGEATGDPRLQTYADWASGWIHATRGDWDAGIEACRRSLEHSRDAVNMTVALAFLGFAFMEKGDLGQAISYLEQSIQRSNTIGYRGVLSWFNAWLSEALRQTGQVDKTHDTALLALAISNDVKNLYGVAWAQRVLGRIALARKAVKEAENYLVKSYDTFAAIQSRFELAKTLIALAELACNRGNEEAMEMYLQEARFLFTVLRAQKHIEKAGELLSAKPAPVRRVRTGDGAPLSLTRREREIALLIARGLTDREIGEELVISEGTVGIHVTHILRKLGYRSRAQIAAWMGEQGLLRTPLRDSDPVSPHASGAPKARGVPR